MAKVLFLDDSEDRIDRAKKFHGKYNDNVHYCKTATEAIEALKNSEFDVIKLDHDLGGEVFVDSFREDCGMEVVRWMCDNYKYKNVLIVVHTWNIEAGKEMSKKLVDSGFTSVSRVPFGYEGIL